MSLFQLLEELLGLEVLGNGLVVPGNDFVDLLLPARLRVFSLFDGDEELPQGGLDDWQKVVRNLEQLKGFNIGNSIGIY